MPLCSLKGSANSRRGSMSRRRLTLWLRAGDLGCGADKIYSELKMALWARPANDQAAC
jgi:hypothetical protein